MEAVPYRLDVLDQQGASLKDHRPLWTLAISDWNPTGLGERFNLRRRADQTDMLDGILTRIKHGHHGTVVVELVGQGFQDLVQERIAFEGRAE